MPLVLTDIQAGMEDAWRKANAKAKSVGAPNVKHIEDGGDPNDMPISASAIDDASAIEFGRVAGIAITDYIKSANVVPGIAVAVAGSPSAQVGATTAPGVIE